MNTDETQKFQIPTPYRITPECATDDERRRLEEADTIQKERRATQKIELATPTSRQRAAAVSKARALENSTAVLTAGQNEQLAEAYAQLGFYQKAAEQTRSEEKRAIYEKYWEAVWMDDAEWCKHPAQHKYIKEAVFSVRDNKEVVLLACNRCGTWNCLDQNDAPENLLEAQKRRAAVREELKGMDIAQAKQYLESKYRK